tara:strand:+ start:233 stop:1792 length:1560 start_codon:yes stop_codon:yes gene_type:complete
MADSLDLKRKKLLLKRKRENGNGNNRFLDKDSARSAVGQGLFFGYGDEIEAKIRSLVGKKTYEELLPEIRASLKAYEQDFPLQSLTNEVIGSIPSGILLTIATGGFATPVVGATRLATLAGKAKPFLQAMGLSGLYGSGKEEGDVVEKIKTGAKTAPFGLVLYPIQKLAGSKPAQAIKNKLNLTIGQKIGGFTKRIEESLKSVPILGENIRRREQDVLKQMNNNMFNKTLEPLKKKINKDKTGFDAFSEVDDIISKEYNKIIPKLELNKFGVDILKKEIKKITTNDLATPNKIIKEFNKTVDDLINDSTGRGLQSGTISGQKLKNLESRISNSIRQGIRSGNAETRENAIRLMQVRKALNAALEKTNPKFAPKLKNINLSFRKFLGVGNAVESGYKNNGIFTTGQLLQGIKKASSPKEIKLGSAGGGLQGEANLYNDVLKNVLPDSGTAERSSLSGLLGLGGTAALTDPVTTALGLGGATSLYTKSGQRIADIATDKLSLLSTSGGLANAAKEQSGLLN